MNKDERPNILIISTDQQRWDTCGPEKEPVLRTPHLDYLAADGLNFKRAYADCPVCVPTRAALMTGKTCFHHGMGANDRTYQYFDEENTLPTVLRNAGYQTAAIGKAHFDPQYKTHGFENFQPLGDYYRWIAQHYGPEYQPRRHGLGENEPYPIKATVPENLTLTSWITEQAAEWIQHRRDPSKPWLLWVSYSKPHPPLDPPEPYYSMYMHSDVPKPVMGAWPIKDDAPNAVKQKQYGHGVSNMHPEHIHAMRAAYYGCITQIDHGIGRILSAIHDTGTHENFTLNDNTMVVFHSDHGDMMGDHGMLAKGEMYEGSARIPFIVRTPKTWNNRHRGEIIDSIATVADILPTVAAAAGADIPEDCDGQNLLAVADDPNIGRKQLLCGQGFSKKHQRINWCGITDGEWKYVWYYDQGKQHLFNTALHRHDEVDYIDNPDYQDQVQSMKQDLEKMLLDTCGADTPYLRAGKLWHHGQASPTNKDFLYTGFHGFMTDSHQSDALH